MNDGQKLCAGEWVEVRTKEEILRTLDNRGTLEALPFMPEMFQYCGKRFRVFKRAHKTCDPPNGLLGRRMTGVVHLENLRCDGQAHGGCQAGCLIFWKEAWLKRVTGSDAPATPVETRPARPGLSLPLRPDGCTEADVLAGTRAPGEFANAEDPTYVCQSTQVREATQPLAWWDLRQYVEDCRSGNVRPSQVAAALLVFLYRTVAEAGLGVGSIMRWAYDSFQRMRGGTPYPSRMGKIRKGERTPSDRLNLQPGELVRVKPYTQILESLDQNSNNRGMYFDAEMVPFCGGTFRVLARVQKIVNEKTGKLLRFRNDAIILQDVYCLARYSKCRKFCPRSIYPYWREVWLERVNPPVPGAGSPARNQNPA
jgi:hypothetical protein